MGGGGNGFLGNLNFLPWMNTNTGQAYSGEAIVKNLFNPTAMGGVFGEGQGTGQDKPGQIDAPAAVVEPIPEDPAIAEAASTEAVRQEEMRKRRARTKTLLSDQEATGNATVGTKVLLGG